MSGVQQSMNRFYRVLRPTTFPIGVLLGLQVGFKYRFQRKDFCARLGLPESLVDAVMSTMTRRSHLATTNPLELSNEWSEALGVPAAEIFQYFREAGYIQD